MLFGHQDNARQSDAVAPADSPDPHAGVNPLAVDPATGSSLPVVPPNSPGPIDTPDEQSVLDQGPHHEAQHNPTQQQHVPMTAHAAPQHPSNPFSADSDDHHPVEHVKPQQKNQHTDNGAAMHDDKPDADALFSLKQQVISELSPLVAQLEQSPEEKYKTTMMLIQSTDNASLLQYAYNLAQQIPHEKARAQALLDIVNEINYFTQQQTGN